MTSKAFTAQLAFFLLILGSAGALNAVDFIRGDINGDGVVSLADAHYYFLFYREEGPEPPCWQAADADNDHDVDEYDAHRIMQHLFEGDAPLEGPFPSPSPSGSSLGEDGWLDCDGTGDSPLEDADAVIQILDATTPGGADRLARIRVRLSTPGAVAGYSGRVLVDPAAITAVPWGDGFVTGLQKGIDLTHNPSIQDPSYQGKLPADVWFSSTRVEGDVLSFAYLDSPPRRKQPIAGEAVDVLDIVVCLASGTRAGAYPLTPEAIATSSASWSAGEWFSAGLLAREDLPGLKDRLEREYIVFHYRRLGRDSRALCRFLSLERRQLYRRCERLGIRLRDLE